MTRLNRYHSRLMLTVLVSAHVTPESTAAFIAASLENARASRLEPGVAQFDLLQDEHDATRFVLIETYRTADAVAAHKTTTHYATWRDTVAPMMAEPRRGDRYRFITNDA